jgi:hypothetical protein
MDGQKKERTEGQTDMIELIVAFCDFAKGV